MTIVALLIGLGLVFFGRRLFWLFVGGAGFVTGMAFANELVKGQPDWLILVISVLAGLVGALLSIFLQRVAIGLAGFLSGAYALLTLASKSGREDLVWVAFVVGGIIGAVLVLLLFDWALIVLSAMTGAILIAESVPLGPETSVIIFAGLFLAGCIAQGAQLRRPAPQVDRAAPTAS
jgi:hypothetical protein